MKNNEEKIQVECVRLFRLIHSKLAWRLFHIPNGGQRNVIVAAKMKQAGQLSGVWDLFLSVPNKQYHGLYIEVKAGKNKLTDNQKEFQKANAPDYDFAVCYSTDEFLKAVWDYLK